MKTNFTILVISLASALVFSAVSAEDSSHFETSTAASSNASINATTVTATATASAGTSASQENHPSAEGSEMYDLFSDENATITTHNFDESTNSDGEEEEESASAQDQDEEDHSKNRINKDPHLTWKETWNGHNETVTRVYLDEHVAVYYDKKTNASITWPFSHLSKAWKYAKETYGSFGPDPHLYVILHSEKHNGCHTAGFLEKSHGLRNVIDCGQRESDAWMGNHSANYERHMSFLGEVIQNGAKDMLNNADVHVCGYHMRPILFYDIYLHLKGQGGLALGDSEELDPDIAKWKADYSNGSLGGIHWFQKWFLPIYEEHGGAKVLNEFFTLTKSKWLRMYNGKYKHMNMGQFVHFWSAAANTNLKYLARQSFPWSKTYENQFLAARKLFPMFNYSCVGPNCEVLPIAFVPRAEPTESPPRTTRNPNLEMVNRVWGSDNNYPQEPEDVTGADAPSAGSLNFEKIDARNVKISDGSRTSSSSTGGTEGANVMSIIIGIAVSLILIAILVILGLKFKNGCKINQNILHPVRPRCLRTNEGKPNYVKMDEEFTSFASSASAAREGNQHGGVELI